MTKMEMSKFRRVLEARVIELDHATRRRDAIQVEGTADELDRRLRLVEREIAGRALEMESGKLRQARAALLRIQEGSYGTCQECEEPISAARLTALPWASLCVECQAMADGDHCVDHGKKHTRLALAMAA